MRRPGRLALPAGPHGPGAQGGFGAGPGAGLSFANRFDFGVQARWNLTELLTADAQRRIALAGLAQTQYRYADLRGKLTLGVRDSVETIRSGDEQLRLARESIDRAEAALVLSKQRLDVAGVAGGASYGEVLLAERTLALARANHIVVLRDYNKASCGCSSCWASDGAGAGVFVATHIALLAASTSAGRHPLRWPTCEACSPMSASRTRGRCSRAATSSSTAAAAAAGRSNAGSKRSRPARSPGPSSTSSAPPASGRRWSRTTRSRRKRKPTRATSSWCPQGRADRRGRGGAESRDSRPGDRPAAVAAGSLNAVYPGGMATPEDFTNVVIEKALGTSGTARNWNTVLKLAALI